MKKIEIELYSFDELSKEAKKVALDDWNNSTDDLVFLTDNLREYIHEKLKEHGFKVIGVSTSANPSIRPLYSLGHSQGDGLMFEGTIEDKKGNVYTIKHEGQYYHEFAKTIDGVDKNGNEINCSDFDEHVYIPICKEVAGRGYDEIEYSQSEENFAAICEANEYMFENNGKMRNI